MTSADHRGTARRHRRRLDGYFIYEGESRQDAIEVAARVPAASMAGAIEVRLTVEW